MVEDYIEVLTDDFLVVGDSLDDCLENFDKVLARCEEANLVLNWEKCQFIVKEGSVLGHKIPKNDIEVDKAKIEIISKLPPHLGEERTEILGLNLTTTPVITYPNWRLSFKLMCDANIELIAIVFSIENCFPYLMGANVIVHMDHASPRYLMSNEESKARLVRWVLLFQKYDIDIQETKGCKNQVANHLSHLEEEGKPQDGLEINDFFPDEQILALSMN
ncbi:PREDICTED: uncharacterized protein LOC109229929 [Nicotiana attenuata]|uniref:uncharacterized protein LOC109229929 n=1 Tax=Nicotiana attenuata TaxID=49451 RepID=UPI000904834D|nr:PREDICTED: uncharacterized protein LOC109229929 [Nicotiana attenuata]